MIFLDGISSILRVTKYVLCLIYKLCNFISLAYIHKIILHSLRNMFRTGLAAYQGELVCCRTGLCHGSRAGLSPTPVDVLPQ